MWLFVVIVVDLRMQYVLDLWGELGTYFDAVSKRLKFDVSFN
jgi:hypothetical protein